MKFTIVGNYSFYQRSPAWSRALRELGHEVIEIHEPLSQTKTTNYLKRVNQHFLIGKNFNDQKINALTSIADANSDINIFHKSISFSYNDIQHLKSQSSSYNILYNNDNIFGPLSKKAYWRFLRNSVPAQDLILCYRESCLRNYYGIGAKDVMLLRSYYLPWLHYPANSPQYKHDISFLGHFENDRRLEYIDYLLGNLSDYDISIRGVGWKPVIDNLGMSQRITTPIYGDAYCNHLRSSKISLCFFSSLNQDYYTRRVFEIPACGSLLMAERTNTMLSLFKEDMEAIYFSSKDELIDKAKFYLQNDFARNKIINNAFQRCSTSGYDIYTAMHKLIGYYQKHT